MSAETSSLGNRFAVQVQPAGSAMARNAEASGEYIIKLAEAQGVLAQAAAQYAGADGVAATVTQASSLGAEDVVISHLINSLKLDIGIFVLETGALHQETLDLLERFKASSRAAVTVYQPVNESVVQFVDREGKDAMYKSIALRKACCGIRKMEPLERALKGKEAWITGLRREQSGARAVVPLVAAVLAQWPHLAQTRVLLVDPVIAPGQSCDRLPRAAAVQIVVGRKADAPRRAMARHLAAELGCALRDQRPLASFGQIQAERARMIAVTVMRLCRWRAYARAPQAGPV